MLTEYLELIQLTELYLLQKLPSPKEKALLLPGEIPAQKSKSLFSNSSKSLDDVKVSGVSSTKASHSPIDRVDLKTSSKVIVPPPLPSVARLPPAPQIEEKKNLIDILNLIKIVFPHLPLLNQPLPEKKRVHLIVNPTNEQEKQVANSLKEALQKEFIIEDNLENANVLIGERACLINHPCKNQIKRDAMGNLKLNKIDVIVISLADLVSHPEKRRLLWNTIKCR